MGTAPSWAAFSAALARMWRAIRSVRVGSCSGTAAVSAGDQDGATNSYKRCYA